MESMDDPEREAVGKETLKPFPSGKRPVKTLDHGRVRVRVVEPPERR